MIHTTLTLPRNLEPNLHAKVKSVIEAFGGRWDAKRQTYLFPPKDAGGATTAGTFLARIAPLDEACGRRPIVKRSAKIASIHRLWKLLAPIVLRQRKDECGIDIMPKTIRPILIAPGSAQQKVYQYHLDNPPVMAKKGKGGKLNARSRIGMQLASLRQAALCPHSPDLAEVITNPGATGPKRSWTDANPKQAAILALCADLLDKGEQVIIGSPFRAFNNALTARLTAAGVSVVMLDGTISQTRRGELAAEFKQQRYSVMSAGLTAMGEGHSFECCSNLVLPSLSWAFDENEQFLHRVWRLNSKKPVSIWTMITRNTIDERMAALFAEKGDSSQLALDGKLTEDQVEQPDLADLLHGAVMSFDPRAETIDEQDIERQWPVLRERLRRSEVRFREFHPPIHGTAVSAADVTSATAALALPSPTPLEIAMTQLRNAGRRARR